METLLFSALGLIVVAPIPVCAVLFGAYGLVRLISILSKVGK